MVARLIGGTHPSTRQGLRMKNQGSPSLSVTLTAGSLKTILIRIDPSELQRSVR